MKTVLRVLVLIALLVLLGWAYVLSQEPAKQPPEPVLEAQDKPLLTEEQKQEIAEDNTATIRVGDELHIYFLNAREALKDYL